MASDLSVCKFAWYQLHRHLAQTIFKLLHDFRYQGEENFPRGGFILASNHVSFYDPPMVGGTTDRPLYFLARKTLFGTPLLHWWLSSINAIPVDQDRPDMVGVKRIIKLLKQGEGVVLFPEGSRSYDGVPFPAMPGVGLIVAKANVPVLPCRIFGGHLAWPRDGRIHPFTPIRLVYGKPIHFDEKITKSKEAYQLIGDRIMAEIAKLQWEG